MLYNLVVCRITTTHSEFFFPHYVTEVFMSDDVFLQILMNAKTPPCLTVRNIVRVSTLRVNTRVTVTLATQHRPTCVLVGNASIDKRAAIDEWINTCSFF